MSSMLQEPPTEVCSNLSLSDTLLHPLLVSANRESLDESLAVLLDASKSATGRSNLASKRVIPHLLRLSVILAQKLRRPSTHLLSSLRILRNLCAGESLNINSFIQSGGVEAIEDIFNSVQFDPQTVCIGLQALANVLLAGNEHLVDVWDHFFPLGFVEVAKVRDKGVCDLLCRILYTLCRGDDRRLSRIGGDQGVMIITEIISTASTAGFEGDYLPWLLSKICYEATFFNQLFVQLSSTNSSRYRSDNVRDVLFTREQVFLLSLLSRIHEQVVSGDFGLAVLQILKKASTAIHTTLCPSTIDTLAVEILEYTLIILRDICAHVCQDGQSRDSPSAVELLLSSGLLTFLLDLLRQLEPPEIVKKSRPQELNQGKLRYPYKGYRGDIVSVIANCAFRRKQVQDEIRQQNGILLLLEQCVVDEGNPFLREKGLWAVRNLLEGNEENQREVAELKLQGTVDTPEVTDLGMRVEVDPESGRAKLVNVSPSKLEEMDGVC
ncbi:hypothetical protein H6P81_007665 [Aristolochia fimbriata]|uniref:Ataxin-10 domain-containing protein n=1 Tax=Aristolochia fimbriata TaxID=158543 RepID=A0AAV7F254_ARIFI|nr:hypothetical protein H6P81_007665 [Aristolochia fimbriata]